MNIQKLIDQIQEIKEDATLSPRSDKDDLEDCLKRIYKICDNILIEWKMENAKCLSLTNTSEKH